MKSTTASKLEDPIVDPSPVNGGSGALSISGVVIGPFTNPYSGSAAKGVLISIQRPMELLSRNYGGLPTMLKRATSDPAFGSQIVSVLLPQLSVKIELPLARLNATNGTLFNGIIVRPDGRVSLVHSHALPDARAAVRQTHTDRISVYGGSVKEDPSDRVIRLPMNGGIGIPGLDPDPEGAMFFSYYTDKAFAISANPEDLPAGTLRESLRNVVNDMRFVNRSYTTDNSPTCTDPNSLNKDIEQLLASQASAFIISRKLVNGAYQPDEVMLCGDDSQGRLMCRPYCWAWVTNSQVRMCGVDNRMILGCDSVKKSYLAPIVQALSEPDLPGSIVIRNDPDGTGQIVVSPL